MSALRHFARRCASSLNTARGLATKAPRKKTGSGKKTAAKAAASAPSPGDDKSPSDHAAGTEDVDGTIGAEADKAAQTAKEAAESFTRWAKGAGAKLGDGAAKAAGGAASFSETADKRSGGMMTNIMSAFKEEYRLAMMDPGDAAIERRKSQPGYVAPGPVDPYEGTTAVAIAKEKKSRFRSAWESVSQKTGLGAHVTSVFSKLEGLKQTPAYRKGEEMLEDARERWETSDNPMVHKIQDLTEGAFFTETEQAEAYRAIQQRIPDFNVNDFMAEVRRDVPKVLGAYLKGDVKALEGCAVSKEMLERMGGQMKLWQHEGQFVDPRILHLSEMELMEVRTMENSPMIVLQFSCQQINCVRNKDGEIVEGAEDDIQSVHYLWAMQLDDVEYTHEDGRKYTAPTWQLREMVLRGMMAVAA